MLSKWVLNLFCPFSAFTKFVGNVSVRKTRWLEGEKQAKCAARSSTCLLCVANKRDYCKYKCKQENNYDTFTIRWWKGEVQRWRNCLWSHLKQIKCSRCQTLCPSSCRVVSGAWSDKSLYMTSRWVVLIQKWYCARVLWECAQGAFVSRYWHPARIIFLFLICIIVSSFGLYLKTSLLNQRTSSLYKL